MPTTPGTTEEGVDVGQFTDEDLARTLDGCLAKALAPILEQNRTFAAQNAELATSNRSLTSALTQLSERQTAVEESVAKAITAIGGVQEIAKGLEVKAVEDAQTTPAPVRETAAARVIAPKPPLEHPEGTVVTDLSGRISKAVSSIRKLQQEKGTSIPLGFDFVQAMRANAVDETLMKAVEGQIAERL